MLWVAESGRAMAFLGTGRLDPGDRGLIGRLCDGRPDHPIIEAHPLQESHFAWMIRPNSSDFSHHRIPVFVSIR